MIANSSKWEYTWTLRLWSSLTTGCGTAGWPSTVLPGTCSSSVPCELHDPDRRHFRASIGHAASQSGGDWTLLPDAPVASDSGAWDDLATWTGSVVRGPDGMWNMFYTGVSRAKNGPKQRIGRAVSTDLITWKRDDSVVLEADPRWYEVPGEDTWPNEAWRDPYVFRHEGAWHMLVTARSNGGDPGGRAVIGHAASPDLCSWKVAPPLTKPLGFGEMEVAQSHTIGGRHLLVFTCAPKNTAHQALPGSNTWIAEGTSPVDPWDVEAR